ncbi:membrane protein insertase YidC [Anaplasma bovis]|uniref:membrane protein insertase YidC n=1 Tax=Anaplasma bovis TaxID=186733 RepID=UPI002FF3D601
MSEVRNLVLAVIASVLIMLGWKFVQDKLFKTSVPVEDVMETEDSLIPDVVDIVDYESREDITKRVPRVKFGNSSVEGSVALVGGILDDLSLSKYKVSIDNDSPNVHLMSPEGTADSSMVEFGWIDIEHKIKTPSRDSIWSLEESESHDDGVKSDFSMFWDNGEGVVFRLKFALDDSYVFTVLQEVENNTGKELHLAHYGRINRAYDTSAKSHWISHEGVVANFGDGLREWNYKDLKSSHSIKEKGILKEYGERSWIGFADKYWFSALISENTSKNIKTGVPIFRAQHVRKGDEDRFQVDFSKTYEVIAPRSVASAVSHVFVGAKELDLLDTYKSKMSLPLFDKAVDFGMLYFITKPVFLLLQCFNKIFGNFGLAIVMLTVAIKLLLLPISAKSCISMFKLRKLQPEVERIKELYKADNLRASKEIAALFKKHKVSPISGFLPIIAQIPVFFALYKVLFVTIEMRHAPLFAWIKDLSNYDPANVLNLFGLLPFHPPICIGVMPILLGITMIVQQKLHLKDSVGSQDPYGIMKFLPYVFIFIFSSFPSGLVLYWICSNVLTVAQQLLIRKIMYRSNVTVGSSA